MNALELHHVVKKYPGFTLRDVSFSLPSGGILGLVGENGAGKSTVIRLLMNTIPRDGGEIFVLGKDNRSRDFRETKEDVGVVLDEACFPETLTVRQTDAVLRRTYLRWDSVQFRQLTDRFSLPEKKPFKDFSRGMKMKLSIAAALAHEPKLLILDEATSGLDPMVRDEILDLFYEFTRDESHSILISSHIVSDLEKLCDYIAFLHQGRLLFCEEKDALQESFGIVRCTGTEAARIPPEAVCGRRDSGYGVELLVRREATPSAVRTERASIEEMILLLAKGGTAK